MIVPYSCKIEGVCSEDETRPNLQTINLEISEGRTGCLIATDGRRMVVLPVEVDTKDVPGMIPKKAFDLERQTATEPPYYGEDGDPVSCNRPLHLSAGDNDVGLTGEILVKRSCRTDKYMKFPDWKSRVDQATSAPKVFSICLNAELLFGIQEALGSSAIKIEFQGPEMPMLVTSFDGIKGALGILMPVRSK